MKKGWYGEQDHTSPFPMFVYKQALGWVLRITMLQFMQKRKEVAFMKKCCDTPPFIG